ncbi:uncharacterized protein LOC134458562 [Engraulis encrasicolus]|uniref:uncharacterized protein LOC134458562 n=1 Tax=Engraulis encrasicolus TaxID=184585 RepID=UPI002FD4F7AD
MRVCCFPNCGNVMRRYLCLSFHRLPYRNRLTLPLWLAVLQLDPRTTLKTLREKDHRVCSEHFDDDDFTEKGIKCRHLKASAVPKAKPPAADKVEETPASDVARSTSEPRLVLSSPHSTSSTQQTHTRQPATGARPLLWKQAGSVSGSGPPSDVSTTETKEFSQVLGDGPSSPVAMPTPAESPPSLLLTVEEITDCAAIGGVWNTKHREHAHAGEFAPQYTSLLSS